MTEFDKFWELFPHKVGKGHAVKAWGRALKKAEASIIIAAVEQQLPKLNADKERGFCPYPSTWLNGERWGDEILVGRKKYTGSLTPPKRQEFRDIAGEVDL